MQRKCAFLTTAMAAIFFFAGIAAAQEILPFPEPPSASVAGKTLKDSKHQWRKTPNRLPKDAPNIVIFMTDDLAEKIDKQLEDLKKSIPLLPVIVIIPSHKGSLGLATLKMRKMVEKALGADILFSR